MKEIGKYRTPKQRELKEYSSLDYMENYFNTIESAKDTLEVVVNSIRREARKLKRATDLGSWESEANDLIDGNITLINGALRDLNAAKYSASKAAETMSEF